MKILPRMFTVVGFTALAELTALGVLAQSTNVRKPVRLPDPAKQAQDTAAYRTGMETAKGLAAAGNVARAEETLTSLNKTTRDSAEWHIETAQRMIQLAEQLAREARPAAVPGLATAALQHLVVAQNTAKNAKVKASAKAMTGYIQERYLANQVAALAAYQGAADLAPTSTKAKEALARLQGTEDNLRAKRVGGGR
jgi:hypothetical protein